MSFHPLIFSHIKLLAGMDIAVRGRPQDRHYKYNSNNNRIFDVRVSTLPGQFVEELARQFFDQIPVQPKLEALGISKMTWKCFIRQARLQVV